MLFFQAFLLSSWGVLLVYSATYQNQELKYLWLKQLILLVVALVFTLWAARVHYRIWIELGYTLFILSIIMLVLVLVFADPTKGARRWIKVAGISFQPSEFAKVGYLLVLVRIFGEHSLQYSYGRPLFKTFLCMGIGLFLIFNQPDLGSAVLWIPLTLVLLFLSGFPVRFLAYGFLLVAVSMPLLWHFLRDYQKKRLEAFLNPHSDPLGAGYNIIQSMIAVGSGGAVGKGFLNGSQTQLAFIPEHHTDFIFSVQGEEWGFLGSLVLVGIFAAFLNRCYQIALRARDREGTLLACGIAIFFTTQVVVNLGMAIGLLPVAGITLPFLSYGGSSLLSCWVFIALLLNIDYSAKRHALFSEGKNYSALTQKRILKSKA